MSNTLDGTQTKELYEYSRDYKGQGGRIYFNTYQTYGNVGKGGINPSTLNTTLLVKKGNDWYKAAILGDNGQWLPLKETQSGILRVTDPGKPGTFSPVPNAKDKNILGDVVIKDLMAAGKKSLRYQAINNAKFLLKNAGKISENEVNGAFNVSSNIASPGHSDTPGLYGNPVSADSGLPDPQAGDNKPSQEYNREQQKILEDLAKDLRENTRKSYPPENGKDLRYPTNLSPNQDCIRFTILEYVPTGLIPTLPPAKSPRQAKPRKALTNITMAIPGGISDRNAAEWSSGNLSYLMGSASSVINNLLVDGADAASAAANKAVTQALSDSKTMTAFAAAKATQAVLGGAEGTNQILSREFGAAENPNMELLFNGPSLRSFVFNFRMSPRDEKEARTIRTILRYFKQAMSVKRTNSIFLLKAPHTFKIEYLTEGGKPHPYLNQIKECALTECTVNYTPDGTYMTFDMPEPSMTAYELQLTFQELEPVFDDEYDDGDNTPTNIGY